MFQLFRIYSPQSLFYLACFLDSGKSNIVFILYCFNDEFQRYELFNDDVLFHTNVMFI
jgi:hypothetical protein